MMTFADDSQSDNPIVWKPARPAASAPHRGIGWSVDGLVGYRSLNNHDFWSPVDHQLAAGFQATLGWDPIPVRGELSFQTSSRSAEYYNDEGVDTGQQATATLTDVALGARVQPVSGWFRPYAGIGFLHESVDGQIGGLASASDSSTGYYVHGGLGFVIARHVDLGLEYRFVRGVHLDLNGYSVDANNTETALTIGYTWK
jgi:opacity protein-like surface antigen